MDPRRMLEIRHFGTMEPSVPPSEPFISDPKARRKAWKAQAKNEKMRDRWAAAPPSPEVPRQTEHRLKLVEPQDVCSPQRDQALYRTREVSEYLKVEAAERDAADRDISYYGASGWGQERLDGLIPQRAPSSDNIDAALYGLNGLYGKHFARPWDAQCSEVRPATHVSTPPHLLDLYGRQRSGRMAYEQSMAMNEAIASRRLAEEARIREEALKVLTNPDPHQIVKDPPSAE